MKYVICALPFLLSCNNGVGIHAIGPCPYPNEEFEAAAAAFIDAVPEAYGVLEGLEVVCVDAPYYYAGSGMKVAGESLWPGSDVLPGRIKIAADTTAFPTVASGATVHEFLHLHLWVNSDNFDPCSDHKAECGWDEALIEEVQDELK